MQYSYETIHDTYGPICHVVKDRDKDLFRLINRDEAEQLVNMLNEFAYLREENFFLKARYAMHSPKMDGEHQWLAVNRWPKFIGPTIDEAVRRVMEELDQ